MSLDPSSGEPALGRLHASATVRAFFIVVGTLSLAVGIVAIVVPLLPTTPFLLLAAACYVRGSERLHGLLLGNALVRGIVLDYRAGRGLTVGTKLVALTTLWGSLALSALIALPDSPWWVRLVMAAVGLAVTLHLLRMPTKRI